MDEDGNLVFEDYKIWNFNGFKVGVFGIANDHTKTKTAPANTEGIEFRDDIETAKKMVDELEDQADYIVALTHIGSQIESEGTSIDLANEVKGIDLILDGPLPQYQRRHYGWRNHAGKRRLLPGERRRGSCLQ